MLRFPKHSSDLQRREQLREEIWDFLEVELNVCYVLKRSIFFFLYLSHFLITATGLGMAWLEIRRAKSIAVPTTSKDTRLMIVDWVMSDHPVLGAPYATFVFNFELDNPFMRRCASPSTLLDKSSSEPSSPVLTCHSGTFRDQGEEKDTTAVHVPLQVSADFSTLSCAPRMSLSVLGCCNDPSGGFPTVNAMAPLHQTALQPAILDSDDLTQDERNPRKHIPTTALSNVRHEGSRPDPPPGPSSVARESSAGDNGSESAEHPNFSAKITSSDVRAN